MDLKQLRSFEAVARLRSFTQAALDLHLAQSAVSGHVSRLERELGVELLRRTTRRVEVTEAGAVVLARARGALAEVDGVRADLDALRGLLRGTLRIGGVPPLGRVHPAQVITDFARAHPGIEITVREDVAGALVDGLLAGELDLVMGHFQPGPGLDGVALHEEELVLVVPAGHRLAGRRSATARDLAGEPLLAYGQGSTLRDVLLAAVPDGRVVAAVNELETLRELAARGLGVTLMPRSVAEGHPDERLALLPLSPARALGISLLWRAGERASPAARAFREHVVAMVGI